MRTERVGSLVKYQWESLSALSQWIIDTPRTWGRVNQAEATRGSNSWDLKAGYDGAVKMARDGWLEGAQAMDAALAMLPPKDVSPDTVTDFYGHLPHVPRFCAGAPDCMIRHSPKATMGGGRMLTLYVTINATADVSATEMKNFGLGVAQYINQIEQQGIRVELWGMTVNGMFETRTKRMSQVWRIKYADQPLDLAVLAFSIGHPAMFRRLGFALMERSEARADDSYGRSEAARLTDLIDPAPGSYILNGMRLARTVAKTPEKALQYVTEQINTMLETPDAE